MFEEYQRIKEEMELVYLHDRRPWMIGYSGGKDSTLLCQLVFEMLESLPKEKRWKPVYIVTSDTMVENPIVKAYMHKMSSAINAASKEKNLNVQAHMIYPDVRQTFWSRVIGLGYPTPEAPGFRWCTERLKIHPSNAFTYNTIKKDGEIVILLGVRKAESAARSRSISSREIEGKILTPHPQIPKASVSRRNQQRAAVYDAALQELSNGNYTSAEQDFSSLSGYRDAASLSVYCKYADMYTDRTDYAGGQDELATITLKYDTRWQQDVDALEKRVKGYKSEKDAAEEAERQRIAAENAAKREQSLKDQYSGKLPVEGMPVSCLKYTSLGEPDKRLDCKNFDKLEQNQKYFNVYWYDENGEMIAAGMCAQWKNDSEYMLKSFSQYYPSGGNNGQTFNYGNGGSNSGSIRDDYDNPEDLWEDNQDCYEDEDEAWDEWYDD